MKITINPGASLTIADGISLGGINIAPGTTLSNPSDSNPITITVNNDNHGQWYPGACNPNHYSNNHDNSGEGACGLLAEAPLVIDCF